MSTMICSKDRYQSLASILYCSLVECSSNSSKECKGLQLVDDLAFAYNKIVNKVIKHNELLGAIRGPPGTGKTKLIEKALADSITENLLSANERVLDIAPTNELVTSTFQRFIYDVTWLHDTGGLSDQELTEILEKVRVYGSAIPPPYTSEDAEVVEYLAALLGIKRDEMKSMLRNIKYGRIAEAEYVFTTDYQKVSARASPNVKIKYLMMVDEASKKPFYLPFIPVEDAMRNQLSEGAIEGLIVVGDDRQAIALSEEYHGDKGKRLLILPLIEEVLKKDNKGDLFTTLGITYRLPGPSEKPISSFYEDVANLRSKKSFSERLREYGLYDWEENDERCSGLIDNESYRLVCNALINTIKNEKPILVIRSTKEIWSNEDYETNRVKFATYALLCLRCLFNNKENLSITVEAPYNGLIEAVRQHTRSVMKKVKEPQAISMGNNRFLTVHSMLGDESDIVISILGKEWIGSRYTGPEDEEAFTIYFREPEILNVQLSRHKLLLVMIGNPTRLVYYAHQAAAHRVYGGSWLEGTILRVLLMAGIPNDEIENIINEKGVALRQREYCGNGACLIST